MIITAEISLYPLMESYEDSIVSAIQNLKQVTDIQVFTNAMSTQIKGEYHRVFRAIEEAFQDILSQENTMSLVIKIINKNCAIEQGFLNI